MFEFKFIFSGLVFFLLFGFLISMFAGYAPADDSASIIDEIKSEHAGITGIVYGGLLDFGVFLFGIFGINITLGFYMLPSIINVLISLFGILLIITFVLWAWEKIIP